MKVEIFYGHPYDIADSINSWLSENPKIVVEELDGAERQANATIYAWYTTQRKLPEKMHVKVFYSNPLQGDQEINMWIADNPRVVIKDRVVMSNFGGIAVFILYTTPR